MYLFLSISNFAYLILGQIFLFKILKLKRYWFLTTFFLFLIICIYFTPENFNNVNILEYFFFNLLIVSCYLIFLTLVFNGSPSIALLKDNNKNKFIKIGFIKHRIKLMKKSKLITKNNKITLRGKLALSITNLISEIFFKEYD